MDPPQARLRVSSNTTQRPAELALCTEFQTLIDALPDLESVPSDELQVAAWIEVWRKVYHKLVDSPVHSEAQNAFRRAGGLEAVVACVRSVMKCYHSAIIPATQGTTLPDLLALLLNTLSQSLREHTGNRAYFQTQVEVNGWATLQNALITPRTETQADLGVDCVAYQRLFGCLFAFALRKNSWLLYFVAPEASKSIIEAPVLWNAEAVPIIFEMWMLIHNPMGTEPTNLQHLSNAVLETLAIIIKASEWNRTCLHRTGITTQLVEVLFSHDLSDTEKLSLRIMSLELLRFGPNNLKEAQNLFQRVPSSLEASDFVLKAIELSRDPLHIHFDLTMHSFASVEISELRGVFPPTAPSIGYTFMAWIRVEEFDDRCHTTIFGALDASQTCFVLLYLERDTHQLVYQTSVTSSRPSVRFKSVTFKKGVWYHLSIVHKRTSSGSASRAALFVNGEFCEQVKSNFPGSPPLEVSGRKRAARGAVQAFFGTPRDLAPRKYTGLTAKFSLASAHLFSEALPDEIIFVYEKLGPRYSGNFQDCLGSFQTYRASAELNLRNEILHAGKEDSSQIAAAIRLKASRLNPERQLLLGITGTACVNVGKRTATEPGSPKNNSTSATDGNFLVVNTAVPSVSEAFATPYGHAIFTGGATAYGALPLDDACWRLSGCVAIGLNLIHVARTDASIVSAVNVLLQLVQENWRNSEAMERENGFGLLAWLLRSKIFARPSSGLDDSGGSRKLPQDSHQLESLPYQLLSIILRFVGYRDDQSHSSMIINPLAYRTLLVDSDVWRKADHKTQQLYYHQFEVFASQSQHKAFNAKRLNRMRVVKKFLDAFKGDAINSEILPLVLRAFKTLVQCTISAEVMRALALFVTFALHDRRSSTILSHRKRPITPSSGESHHLAVLNPEIPHSGRNSPLPRSDADVVSIDTLGLSVLKTFTYVLCGDKSTLTLKRFAKTVTNKWLLHLFAEDEQQVVMSAMRILARLLVVHGPAYVEKFSEKTHGFIILQERLKRWWKLPQIWTACFAILFGIDIYDIDVERAFDPRYFFELFPLEGLEIRYPAVIPVITSLIQEAVIFQSLPANSEIPQTSTRDESSSGKTRITDSNPSEGFGASNQLSKLGHGYDTQVVTCALHFLAHLNLNITQLQDYMLSSSFMKEVLGVLYTATTPNLTIWLAEKELSEGDAISSNASHDHVAPSHHAEPVRRTSSFVLVSPQDVKNTDSLNEEIEQPLSSPETESEDLHFVSIAAMELKELLITIFINQLLNKADFTGFGLFLNVPPGPFQNRSAFKSFFMESILSRLATQVEENPSIFFEPRALTNLARLAAQLCEATCEGWFENGALRTLDFLGQLMTLLQGPEVRNIKSVRLCAPSLVSMRNIARRLALMRLSSLHEISHMKETLKIVSKWQSVLLYEDDGEDMFIRLICYLLYRNIVYGPVETRSTTIELWRRMIAEEPEKIALLSASRASRRKEGVGMEFVNSSQADNETFSEWLEAHQKDLSNAFLVDLKRSWTDFVKTENTRSTSSARTRLQKRKERVRLWQVSNTDEEAIWVRHKTSTSHWIANIQTSELLKHQRAGQDQQDNSKFMDGEFLKLEETFRRICNVQCDDNGKQWQLDEAEGRDRIRLRLVSSSRSNRIAYRPKRNVTLNTPGIIRSRTHSARQSQRASRASSLRAQTGALSDKTENESKTPAQTEEDLTLDGEEFEIVPNPPGDVDDPEDKNRKVLRSLQRGEEVQNVCNVSRIVGLEACESLLIIGRDSLYLLDNLFQRSDGEIVNVWHAPQDERDPYVLLIAGREPVDPILQQTHQAIEKRSWAWSEIISISKRHFLFRDVAVETFFKDGRSYLLTTASLQKRDELYAMLLERAPDLKAQTNFRDDDDLWRLAVLKQTRNPSQTLGFKFPNVFGSQQSNSATRSWQKGEISNFHYLMMINTMAGRTFNDLTQYPVFPWVIADYTSEELDLTDPRTFRDLSKPMGCQTLEREATFKDRYTSFGEMTDHRSPAFHYGTHYSSAMIVTSFLIRLQPFVHSYVLLQGGSFDHADRLFYSVEKAWLSASREGMSDVRELTPEFFYLPDFLTNVNGYDFGVKEGDGESIDDVVLPPWAKGDPTIFIAKHREALESQYVSENLHHWIDLVFGFKQQGEAAVEATNVFHHLSYHGAKDLDTILDPMERLATIGIIHNFGQTPRQIFQKPHEQKEDTHPRIRRLDTAVDSLSKIPSPLIDSGEIASNLIFSTKRQKLISSARHKIFLPPDHEIYMEWNFADGSVRFFSPADKKLLGIFEQLHQAQISCAHFADSKTLITASYDCTIAVWWVTPYEDSVVLHPKGSLFGHRKPVSALTASRALSVIVSASSDGHVLLWDLNRLQYVRELTPNRGIEYARINNSNGHILLCSRSEVLLYTLNGTLLLEQKVSDDSNEELVCCAFYESESNEWLEKELVFTGHRQGLVKVWCLTVTHLGKWQMQLINRLDHSDNSRGDGRSSEPAITSILPMAYAVYTGDEKGRVYKWEFTV